MLTDARIVGSTGDIAKSLIFYRVSEHSHCWRYNRVAYISMAYQGLGSSSVDVVRLANAKHTATRLPVRTLRTLIRESPVTHTSGSPFSA
jgi:hypothetical protein